MKTFENGAFTESDGPPLEHDEWVEAQQKAHAAEQKAKDRARQSGGRTSASNETGGEDDDDLESLTVPELKDRARDAGVEGFSTMHKSELVEALSAKK